MASLDRNIIIMALPTIASELHTSLLTLVWIAIGYWVVTASVLLNFGRLADMFGRVRLYNLGFAIFTVGSALCGISQTGEQLIVFRVIQAVGAALLFSNSTAILTDTFPENERGKALGLNQVSIVIGSVIGLAFGGFLIFYLGWQSIFWINVPIGIFASVWSYTKLKELGTIKKEPIDWIGNISFAGGIFLVLIGITFGSFQVIHVHACVLLIITGLVLLFLFYKVEKKVAKPMFDFTLFRINTFTGGNVVIFLNALARGAFSLVMIFYLQGPAMNLSPLDAGIYLIPVSLALAIFAPISGWLYDRYRLQLLINVGLLLSAAGFLVLAMIHETMYFLQSLVPLILVGAGMGIFASPNRASIMNSVSSYMRGTAAGISTTLVMLGSAFSIGMVFLIFTQFMSVQEAQNLFVGSFSNDIGTSSSYDDLLLKPAETVNKFVESVQFIFFISAFIMIISTIPSIIRHGYVKHDTEY
ncbi:MAG: MFS transporter [Thermoproteota archaeon]|nr:MFS transporter [Thermoproteota archaeon]